MNAVLSAQTLDWRSSVAYRPDVQIAVRPFKVYEFNARATLEQDFRDRLRDNSPAMLRDYGFEDLAATLRDDRLAALQMTDAELKGLSELVEHFSKNRVSGSIALETELAKQGYGMPAIAILILAVAIAVFLWVIAI